MNKIMKMKIKNVSLFNTIFFQKLNNFLLVLCSYEPIHLFIILNEHTTGNPLHIILLCQLTKIIDLNSP